MKLIRSALIIAALVTGAASANAAPLVTQVVKSQAAATAKSPAFVALNPQPIPPGEINGLNPQPLPPKEVFQINKR